MGVSNNRHDEAKQNDVGPKGARRQSEEEKKTTPKEMKKKQCRLSQALQSSLKG
jgi:hypothetical protein